MSKARGPYRVDPLGYKKANEALDKKAENARELGLDYEPAQQEPVAHRDGFWCADLTCKKCYSADFRFKHKNSVVNESLTTPAQYGWTTKQIAGMARLKEAQDKNYHSAHGLG